MSFPVLEIMFENGTESRVEVRDRVFIGRVCMGIEPEKRILVSGGQVSRDHAVITWDAYSLFLTDTSKNGTWVSGTRMSPGSSQRLTDGDVVQIGDARIKVSVSPDATQAGSEDDGTVILTQSTMVTNVVADVRGFSGLGQQAGSLEVFQMVRRIFEIFSSIVRSHKGTVKDYIGDAVYAFWEHRPAPSAAQALLACQAALSQARGAREILKPSTGKQPREKIALGWGITTGQVTLSHYTLRPSELAVVGDSTNLAFRLSGLANKQLPSEIVLCSQTAKLVEKELALKDLGSVPIRGREGEEHVYGLEPR